MGDTTAEQEALRPRLLDLFCGAGGCSVGYYRAGFDVVGVDIEPHPDYPFEFHQADAMTFPLEGFDVVHASPPCQAYTTMGNRFRGAGGLADSHADLLEATRDRLETSGSVWVLENVVGARAKMRNPVLLHGGMFGLGVLRPRLFESNVLIMSYTAPTPANPIGVYGALDGRRLMTRADGTEQRAAKTIAEASAAMGIDWMDWDDLREAIPPAYCQFIGEQLLAHVTQRFEVSA